MYDLIPDGPLISQLENIRGLRTEYEAAENFVFVEKIDWLMMHGYTGIRRSRSDGECTSYYDEGRTLNSPLVLQEIASIEVFTVLAYFLPSAC